MLAPYARLAMLRAAPTPALAPLPPAPATTDTDAARTPSAASTASAASTTSLSAKLGRLVRRLHRQNALTGIQIAVYRGEALVAEVCGGVMGEADPRMVQPDSLFNCFSVTKGIAAMALHLLVDDNIVAYDAPVSKYWPAFAANGKDTTTVRHVLAHQTGLHREPTLDIKLADMCNWDEMLQHMARATPATPVGTLTRYHVLSFGWLVGGVVRGATGGQHLRDVVRQRLACPLGIESECMLGLGGLTEGAETPAVASRLTTLCNGLFARADGTLPDESEVHQLLATFRAQDAARREEEAQLHAGTAPAVAADDGQGEGQGQGQEGEGQGQDEGRDEAVVNDATAVSVATPASENPTLPRADEIVYPFKLQKRENRYENGCVPRLALPCPVLVCSAHGQEASCLQHPSFKRVPFFSL